MSQYLLEDAKSGWTEAALTADLKAFLEMSGWIVLPQFGVGGGIADLFAIRRGAYADRDFRAYEVKVSRSDFRKDEGSNKWRKYWGAVHRVYFASPTGVLTKADLPREAGLIVRGDKGWHVAKPAIGHEPPELNLNMLLGIIFTLDREKSERRRARLREVAREDLGLKERARRIGHQIAQQLTGQDTWKLRHRQETAEAILRVCSAVTGRKVQTENNLDDLQESLTAVSRLMENIDLVGRIGSALGAVGNHWVGLAQARQMLEDAREGR